MAKQQAIKSRGIVTEALGDSRFRVALENGHTIMCHLAGKIRLNQINIIVNDEVEVELSPYDLTNGRIVTRLTKADSADIQKPYHKRK